MFHAYSTDSEERIRIPFILAVIGILLAWGFHGFLGQIVPWWIDAPSVIGFYGILVGIFEKNLWKIPFLKKVGLVKIPNLNGEWTGHIRSSFDSFKQEYLVRVSIYQSWSNILISLETDKSKSRSVTTSILVKDPRGSLLFYGYQNNPQLDAVGTMNIHYGTAQLTFSVKGGADILAGDYFTGRGRGNYGEIYLERVHAAGC